jgi:hypothetical protein
MFIASVGEIGRSGPSEALERLGKTPMLRSLTSMLSRLFSPRRRADDFKALLMADLGLKY